MPPPPLVNIGAPWDTNVLYFQIREKFDSGEDVELTDDMNPHDVACLLKEFFRSLPEPLMTVELFTPFLSITSELIRVMIPNSTISELIRVMIP